MNKPYFPLSKRLSLSYFALSFPLSFALLFLSASYAVAGIDDQPYEGIPFLPSMTVAELKEKVSKGFDQSREIAEIRKFAEKRKIRLFLLGKKAIDALHEARIQSLSDLQLGESQNPERTLNQLLGPDQRLKIAVVNQSGDCPSEDEIVSLRTELAPFFEGFSPVTVGFRSLPEGRFQLEIEDSKWGIPVHNSFVTPIHDSFAGAYVEITSKSDSFSEDWIGDLTGSISSSPAFLKSMASGVMTLKDFFPHSDLSKIQVSEAPFDPFIGDPFVGALRLLIQKQRYGLEMDLSFLESLRRIFISGPRWRYLSESWDKYAKEREALLTESLDIEDTWNTLHYLQADTYFMEKEPLRSIPHPSAHRNWDHRNYDPCTIDSNTAESLGISTLTHSTRDRAYQVITSHPANKLNACISRDGHKGENAFLGDGFYTVVGNYGAHYSAIFPKALQIEVSKKAVQNVHFIKGGGRYGVDYCRLISSDPNFVRVLNNKKHPLYRPRNLPRELVGFGVSPALKIGAFIGKCLHFNRWHFGH